MTPRIGHAIRQMPQPLRRLPASERCGGWVELVSYPFHFTFETARGRDGPIASRREKLKEILCLLRGLSNAFQSCGLKLTHRNGSLRNIDRIVSAEDPQAAIGLGLNLKARLKSSLLHDLHALLWIRVGRQGLSDGAVD